MTAGVAASTVLPARRTSPALPTRRRLLRLWTHGVPVAALLLAVLVRLVQWAGGRSLWLDEAMISASIVSRGYGDLVGEPLLYRQAAPPLWLWAEAASVQLLGNGERALRLVPLLCGIAVLGLAAAVARRVLPAVLFPVVVLLVAANPVLLYYSNEVKQYSSDVALTLLVVLLALRALEAMDAPPGTARRRLLVLAAAGSAAVWASHIAVLPLAGVSIALVLRRLRAAGPAAAVGTGLLLTPWLVSLGIAYVQVLARVRENSVLVDSWGSTYPTGLLDLPAWLGRRAAALVEDPLTLGPTLLAVALLLGGTVALASRRPWPALVVGLPIGFGLLAAALSLYPLTSRLALWTVPLVAVLLAGVLLPGAPTARRPARRVLLPIVALALFVAALPSLRATAPALAGVQHREELGPVVKQMAARMRADDLVLPEVATQPAFAYYGARHGVDRDGVVFLSRPSKARPCQQDRLLASVFAQRRVWVLFSHQMISATERGTRRDLLARIATVTRVAERIEHPGAGAVLFDPTAAGMVEPATGSQALCLSGGLLPGR